MRRTVPILFMLFLAALPLRAAGDENMGERQWRGLSVAEALQVLQGRGLRIIFTTEVVRPGMRVAAEPSGDWPREILDEILAPHGLAARPGPGATLLIVEAPRPGTIRGRVRSAAGAGVVADARIAVLGTSRETRSDRNGDFAFPGLPSGTYSLEAEKAGYFPGRLAGVEVKEGKTARVTFALTPADIPPEEVVVTPNSAAAPGRRPEEGRYIGRGDLLGSPGADGDALRGLGRLPEIARTDLSARMNVRGGADDETMFLLDGIEIYEPFHLQDRQGPLSAIDPRTIGGLQVFGGVFPADYGGRMGGVLDMESVAPSDAFRTGILLGSDLYGVSTQGGFGGGAGRWLFSGRQGDPVRLLDALGAEPIYHPKYRDLFGSLDFEPSPGTTLSFRFLDTMEMVEGLEDVAPETVPGAGMFRSRHGGSYAWVRLRSAWRPRWLSESLLSVGELRRNRFGSGSEVIGVTDVRTAGVVGLRQGFAFETGRNFLRWGMEARSLRAGYRYMRSDGGTSGREVETNPSGREFGLYVSDRFDLTSALSVDAGIRWDRETYTGFGDATISPRLNLALALAPRTTLRAGWGLFYQPQKIYELQVEDGLDRFFPVQRTAQVTLGLDHAFRNGLELTVGAYRKAMTDLRPRFENLFDPFGFFPESNFDRVRIDPEAGRARGLELRLRGPAGPAMGWWAAGTLASVEDRVAGAWIPRGWDQRFKLDAGLNARIGNGWAVTVAGSFGSGRPTTPLGAEARPLPDGSTGIVPVIGPRNSDRLPAFGSVDLRIDRRFDVGGTELRLFLDVTNLLDRDNVLGFDSFDFLLRPDGTAAVGSGEITGLPRLITFGTTWSF